MEAGGAPEGGIPCDEVACRRHGEEVVLPEGTFWVCPLCAPPAPAPGSTPGPPEGSPPAPQPFRGVPEPGAEPTAAACADLRTALDSLGARRLVVGHTPQARINGACAAEGRAAGGAYGVYRIDVGLSAAMLGGAPQALEILRDGSVRVLDESTASG